jgi:isoprenylcysteine carboxyl methyltransferase (ICMT) family protein YpbQ
VANRLRGSSESGDGVEEGMILEKCQKKAKFPWKSVKKPNFLFAVIKKCVILLSVKSRIK